METRYDREVDALAIVFRKTRIRRTVRVTLDIRVDLDQAGHAVSIEILNASRHLDAEALDQTQPAGEFLSLADAGRESGLSPSTLRGQIHKGKLKGEKRGREWVVDATALENYLDAWETSGRRAASPKARRRRSVATKQAPGRPSD